MKRNRESSCRIKLIQEKNLSKKEQKILMNALQSQAKSYAQAYHDYRSGYTFPYDVIIGITRSAAVFRKLSMSTFECTMALEVFSDSARMK